MRVTGMGIGFVDVGPEHALEYNRWWDLTMGPENAALPGLAGARRYVAPPAYQALRGPVGEDGFEPGRAQYCHAYWFGADDLAAAMASMADLARRLGEEGRGFGRGRSRYEGPLRLVRGHARRDLGIAPDAIPHLGHLAIQVSIGVVTEPARIPEVHAWHDEVHLPDVLETPGFLAALRMAPVDPQRADRFLHLFYLDEPPERALRALRSRLEERRAGGRLEAPGGAVRPVFGGPYRPLVPLHYDFL